MKPSSSAVAAQFQKPLFAGFDTRFFIILLCALIVESSIVYVLSRQPVEEYSQQEIERIQERFANFVLGESIKPAAESTLGAGQSGSGDSEAEPEAEAPAPEAEGGGEAGSEAESGGGENLSGGARQAARAAAASAQREAMSREVSNKGLLRMLTGTGSAAQGNAVSDLLASGSGGSSGANLDDVLSSAGGLKTSGTSGLSGQGGEGRGGAARGGRSGGAATIDDLVSDLGTAKSQSMERKGDLAVETPADVIGRGQRAVNRSAQEIQRVIVGHIQAIQYCYERELKRNPDLKGKVTVRITVNPDGEVSDVSIVSSTIGNARVERCILSRISQWKDFKPIDAADGDVSFRQSFTFGY